MEKPLEKKVEPKIQLEKGLKEKLRTGIDNANDLVVYSTRQEILRILIQNTKTGDYVLNFADLVNNPNDKQEGAGLILIPGDSLFLNPSTNIMVIPLEEFRDPRKIFSLLHELGHFISIHKKVSAGIKKNDALSGYDKLDMEFGVQITKEEAEAVLKEERDAWAKAIQFAKKIRREYSVDLFKLFNNSSEFMGWFRVEALRTYEDHFNSFIKGLKINRKDKQVKIWKSQRRKGWAVEEEKLHTEIEKEVASR